MVTEEGKALEAKLGGLGPGTLFHSLKLGIKLSAGYLSQ